MAWIFAFITRPDSIHNRGFNKKPRILQRLLSKLKFSVAASWAQSPT